MSTPAIDRVEIRPVNDDRFRGLVDGKFITVDTFWTGVDRPLTHSFMVSDDARGRKLADRLRAAILAGAVFVDVELATDINGATFAATRSRVMGKYLNADLRKLGF